MKRKWLAVPMVAGMLAVGLTSASALAHNDEDGESPREMVAGKVAEILGIGDEQAVKDALQQATREVQETNLDHRLDHMVEAEKLTQEQADHYFSWYKGRPVVLNFPRFGRNLHKIIDLIIEMGMITQEQADEYTEWFESKPDGLYIHRNGGREEGRPHSSSDHQGDRGEGSLAFGQRPDRGEGSESRRLPNRREFPGRVEFRSRFSERFDGRGLPGRDSEVHLEIPSEEPERIGTSL